MTKFGATARLLRSTTCLTGLARACLTPFYLFTKRMSLVFYRAAESNGNKYINCGNVARFSLVVCVRICRLNTRRGNADAFHFRRPPNRERSRTTACEYVRVARARARERAGSAFCFGGYGGFYRSTHRLTVESQVYGLFQAVCYRRRHIFKASRDRDIAALNFTYAHARANNRTRRETSHNAGVSISGNPRFQRVIKLSKFCAGISFRFHSKTN